LTEWTQKAAELADALSADGYLRTQPWREAVRAVPRHELVPYYYTQNNDATWTKIEKSNSDSGQWLNTIYSDTTLVTALADYHPQWGTGHIAVSSSTAPGLMVSMLETLNVREGDRVLEIGTGTGYNAGLLAHRLGSDNVFSVDVDGELVELARDRLAAIGYTPALATRDGDQGLTEYAEYDRIIATCAVPSIPLPWIDQTTQGGLILADFKPGGIAGNLVLLERRGDTATGRFLPGWAGFMTMRHPSEADKPSQPRRDRAQARERRTAAPLEPWTHVVPWFLAQFHMPDNLTYGQSVRDESGELADTFLSATDGSWCEVSAEEDNGQRRVLESGPVSLWGLFEEAYEQWRTAGEPSWDRLGLTVTPDAHTVWLDHPDGNRWWGLPE
jgi:methyltransferase of ATP-grasp peptide maturase system